MKRLLPALILLLLVVPVANGATPSLTYVCQPSPQDCDAWYRTSVALKWDWNNSTATPSGGNCNDRVFTADTAGTKVFCEVKDDATSDTAGRTATIRID